MRLSLRAIRAAPPGIAECVIRDFGLEVAAGEWIAVQGPNGGGKSTLLLVAAGLLPPRSGERDIAGPAGRPVRVATILQDPSVQLFAPTVAEEIGLTALHLGMPSTAIDTAVGRWAARLGLEGDLARAPLELSAGRQQLVLVAAALACEPDLLVADEPGAHLDAETRARVLDAVKEECRRGMSVLWATQEPAERVAADRVVEIAAGGMLPGGSESAAPVGPTIPRAAGEVMLRVAPLAVAAGPRVHTPAPIQVRVAAGDPVALVGPNGAGKSVILAAACGILDLPQIEVARPGGGPPPLLVSQYPERQIFEEWAASEVIFAAVARGVPEPEARRRAAVVLEALGAPHLMGRERRTWELSAGERRLVLLAGALIAPAGLLALDEPTAGLDAPRRSRLAAEVQGKAAECPVLVASQDPEWVKSAGLRPIRVPADAPTPSASEKTD